MAKDNEKSSHGKWTCQHSLGLMIRYSLLDPPKENMTTLCELTLQRVGCIRKDTSVLRLNTIKDSIFNRLQKLVSRLAILGVDTSSEDLNVKFLRSLPSEWDTHVVVWMNKPDFETISLDDFPSSTNTINTANTGVSTGNSKVNTASAETSLLSFSVQQPMPFVFSTNKINQELKKDCIDSNSTAGYDKSKVECFNCHKMDLLQECRDQEAKTTKLESRNSTKTSRYGKDEIQQTWLSAVSDSEVTCPKSCLEQFQHPEINWYGPRNSSSKPTTVCNKESNNSKENIDESLIPQPKSVTVSSTDVPIT
ncbi:hypothetical protein Tco_0702832 [Tanacetum coccineum]|uniref:Uncharacterized protein n=1 Tax=Tanacetum coccineum TaxID=301880 RepID=A0ABQ4XYQ0_9ASTR